MDRGRHRDEPTSAVIEYLSGRGVSFLVLPEPSAHRTEETVARHGAEADQLVRAEVVVHSRFGPALAVIPAASDLDEDLLRTALNDPDAHLATERELAMHFPDQDPRTIPPLGLFYRVPLYVDPEVIARDRIVFAAGRASIAISMSSRELFRDDPIVIAPLTRRSADGV